MVEKNSSIYSNPKRVSLSLYVINTMSTLLPSTSLNSLNSPFLCVFNPLAIPLYKRSLEKGLEGVRKDMCLIQLASSLRVIGELKKNHIILDKVYRRTKDPAFPLLLTFTLKDLGMEKKRFVCWPLTSWERVRALYRTMRGPKAVL